MAKVQKSVKTKGEFKKMFGFYLQLTSETDLQHINVLQSVNKLSKHAI